MGVSHTNGVACWCLWAAALYRRALCMFGCLPVVYVLGCVLMRGQQKQTKFTCAYVRNRPRTDKPGKSYYPLPPEKNFERTSRELQCSDRAQTSTTGSGRSSCVDVRSVLAKSARTKRYYPKQTNVSKYTYTYKALLRGVWCSCAVTQAGMSQEEIIHSPSCGTRSMRVISNQRNI